ncbi:hypothetical protein CHARACLAT_012724, partial [Characodon lateralis]|nr:hypothetical protein [Characodon lateralis]
MSTGLLAHALYLRENESPEFIEHKKMEKKRKENIYLKILAPNFQQKHYESKHLL